VYVVFAEEVESLAEAKKRAVETLEQAFAQIVCRLGYAYHFEQEAEGWKMVLTDVERPEASPEPIVSSYKRPRDAKHDLIAQAVDGRLKGHMAVALEVFSEPPLPTHATPASGLRATASPPPACFAREGEAGLWNS
jgi:hypothetical protein